MTFKLMRETRRIVELTDCVALAMAISGFFLGSAAFTPALVFTLFAIPLATFCFLSGVRRLSIVTLYWAIAALIAVPLAQSASLRVDYVLLVLGIAGLMLSLVLYLSYVHAQRNVKWRRPKHAPESQDGSPRRRR